jgi:hypothetical protein
MADKEQTGASDATYDLVSALYHATKAANFAMTAQQDAQEQGDAEVAAFYEHLQAVQKDLAERARALLAERLGAQVGSQVGSAPKAKPAAGGGKGKGKGGKKTDGAAVHASAESDTASASPARNLEHRDRDESGKREADAVEEASLESFPASDPPSY